MSLNLVFEIYLWALIVVCLLTGGIMTTLVVHEKRHKENAEATEKWINTIQTAFWCFVLVMGLIGMALLFTTAHWWQQF